MHSVKQPPYCQELMSPKFKQKHLDSLNNQSQQKINNTAYQYPFELFFPKNDHNRKATPSHPHQNYMETNHNSKNNHHYTPSAPTQSNTNAIQNRLHISNHLNPIQNKIVSPLIKNSKNLRPNSQDNKHQYQAHNQIQSYPGQSQVYTDGKYCIPDSFIKRRAQSQKKNYVQQQTQVDNSERAQKKQKSTFFNLSKKANINIDQLHLNENNSHKSPYKPPIHNIYNRNYQDHASNLTKSNCHSLQKILFTPSQSVPQSPLAQMNRSPQFVTTYPNSQTSSLSSLKQFTPMQNNGPTRKKFQKVEQKHQPHIDKDNKFLQKCLYHIMIQNNCLSKQMVMKQIQLSRLKHKLTNYELKLKKQQSILTSVKNDSSSNMQVINSLNNQDQIIEQQQWNANLYSKKKNWVLNQENQENRVMKRERQKKESLQRIEQSEERDRSDFNIEYSVSKQIKQVKQEEEESCFISQNNIQASPTSNKKQKMKEGKSENQNKSEKNSSREVMKSENNVNCQSFQIIQDTQRNRLHTVQNDRQMAINLQQVNKLIQQIEIQQHKLKFKSVISVDSPVSITNFNLISNSMKSNSNRDRRRIQTKAKDQIIEENIDLTQKAHKLEGLDVTRLDRLRMRKGVVSRKNQQV